MKKSIFIVVAIVTTLAMLSLLAACGDDAPLPKTDRELLAYRSEGEYTVWSFNIRLKTAFEYGTRWDERKADVVEYIDTSGADVLCLQEVTKAQYDDLAASLKNYGIIWYPRDGGSNAEGLAILYSDDFTATNEERFWLSETPDVQSKGWGAAYPRICVHATLKHTSGDVGAAYPRICVHATLKHTSGDVLDVYNVHLDHISGNARINGIKLVVDRAFAAGGNAVIAGDFNADTESDCYAAISESFTDAAHASDSQSGYTYNDWGLVNHYGDSPIDHIFLSENLTPKVFRVLYDHIGGVDGEYYSDHYAIGVRFAVA